MASLAAVQAILKAADSQDAASLCALIDNNKVGTYRSGVRQRFGSSEADRPQLGNKFALFNSNKIPAFQDLRETFLHAFEETPERFADRDMYFAPATPVENTDNLSDKNQVSQIVDNLRSLDLALENANHVIAFWSEALDNMRNERYSEPHNLLHSSVTKCAIVPANTVIHLNQSNEGTTTMTLLSGSIVWVIWPPTDHNHRTLQAAYEDFAEDFDGDKLDITQNLEHGLMLLQHKGEGLRVPPFCPMMSFATTTSVIAISTTVTIDEFISTLQKAPLLKAHFKVEPNSELKQTEFNVSILKWLDQLLNGKINADTETRDMRYKLILTDGGPLHTLINTWDDVKDGLAAMMSTTEHETMKDIWSVFLTGSKGRECKLCGKRVPKKPSTMREHFADKHWPKDEVAGRVDSMEVASQGGNDGGEYTVEDVEATGSKEVEMAMEE